LPYQAHCKTLLLAKPLSNKGYKHFKYHSGCCTFAATYSLLVQKYHALFRFTARFKSSLASMQAKQSTESFKTGWRLRIFNLC
jgi:hypothetical protein